MRIGANGNIGYGPFGVEPENVILVLHPRTKMELVFRINNERYSCTVAFNSAIGSFDAFFPISI